MCSFQNGNFNAKGKLGEMNFIVDPLYTVDIQETEIFVNPKNEKDKLNPKWGTMRSLISNIVTGVSKGFYKTLELNGTGYRASISGTTLELSGAKTFSSGTALTFSNPNEKTVKVVCSTWQQTYTELLGSSVNATFNRVYEP